MKFKTAWIKSVKANIASKTITIAFEVDLKDMGAAQDTAKYIGEDAGSVAIEITPAQQGLFQKKEPEQS